MSTGNYSYTSNPRALPSGQRTMEATQRALYRDPSLADTRPANIMFDPRVVRGVTTGRPVLVAHHVQPEAPSGRAAALKRAAERNKLVQEGLIRPKLKSVGEIHATIVVPKKRTPMALHLYLEEQAAATETSVRECQTDAMLERPPTPPYIPRKVGKDTATQVETERVFEFDRDSQPLVELLITTTLEQALREVRQSEELKNVDAQRRVLEQRAATRQAEMDARVAAERDLAYKKERLLADAHAVMAKEKVVRGMLASHTVAKHFLTRLQEDTLDALTRSHFFQDPHREAVTATFLPWLTQRVSSKLAKLHAGSQLTDDMLRTALAQARVEADAAHCAREAAESAAESADRARRAAAAAAQQSGREIKLYIHTNLSRDPVGPILLTVAHTVSDVESRVVEWLEDNAVANQGALPPLDRLCFLWSGRTLPKDARLADLGLPALSDLQMLVRAPSPAAGARGEEEGEEGEEEGPEDGEELEGVEGGLGEEGEEPAYGEEE